MTLWTTVPSGHSGLVLTSLIAVCSNLTVWSCLFMWWWMWLWTSSLVVNSQPKSIGLVWGLPATRLWVCRVNSHNWGYQNSETPEPIVTKFGMGDYVGDMTQQAKIQIDRPSGGIPANGWNITLAWFLIFFCDHDFCSHPETKPENRFLRGLLHKMSIPGYWFPRGIKLQKNFDCPYFNPQNTPKMGVNRHFQV